MLAAVVVATSAPVITAIAAILAAASVVSIAAIVTRATVTTVATISTVAAVLPRAAVVATSAIFPTSGRPAVGAKLDQLAANARLSERVDNAPVETLGKLHKREVIHHPNATKVVTRQTPLICDGSNNLAGIDFLSTTDLDAVHRIVPALLTRSPARPVLTATPIIAIPVLWAVLEEARSLRPVA